MKRILAIVMSIMVLLSFLFLCAQFRKKEERIPFDVEGWNGPMVDIDADVYFTGTRLKMVDDLLKRYDFHGWHLQDVKDLLGEPCNDYYEEQKHIVEYDLRDGLKLLVFEVDERLNVTNYYTYIDD
jgi:hypothetical protein